MKKQFFSISSLFIIFIQSLLFAQNYPNPFYSLNPSNSNIISNRVYKDLIVTNSIIDTIIVKDTLYKPSTGYILDSVKVIIGNSDSSNNISSVYLISIKPDGSYANGGNPLILDRKTNGLFFLIFQLNSEASVGTYKWIFYAKDSQNIVRDSVTKFITVVGSPAAIKYLPVLANDFQLNQNYPNPFNPTTTINYFIPKTSFVTLKVYNVLSKEIATLVNEEKPAGNYNVMFSGNGLSSGIYFYRINAGGYTQTRKMILMK